MSLEELSKFTTISKYGRYLKNKSRRETWEETVERYCDMVSEKYPSRKSDIDLIKKYIENKEVMPSMRGLQFGGEPIFKHNSRIYNCAASYIDRLSFFGEAFYLLLCGTGVGCSVQQRHLQYLPKFSKARLNGQILPTKKYIVEDSIEGWANCSHALFSSFFEQPVPGFEEYMDCNVEYVYDGVRPKGSELSFGIGTAPGPEGLRTSNILNRQLLLKLIWQGEQSLTDVGASDLFLNYSDAVLSGGVRRSACSIKFDRFSEGMLNYKTGNWFTDNPQRARANISAVLKRDEITREDFDRIFQSTKQFGEPGFWLVNSYDDLTNPCFEILLHCYLYVDSSNTEKIKNLTKKYDGPIIKQDDGTTKLSGFQFCNLTTINGSKVKESSDLYNFAAVAAKLGTYQAGFTNFPFLTEITEEITKREALLGVSISGMMHNPDVMLNPEVLRKASDIVKEVNACIAKQIGINPAARNTCEKPDGNSASALGTFPGGHGGKIRRGFRIVQVNKDEPVYEHFLAKNYFATEESGWSREKTDDIIRFCVEYKGILEEDMTAIEFLNHIRTVKKNWVNNGRNQELCVPKDGHHNVSCTVMVRDHEWDEVEQFLYDNKDDFGGVSFIGHTGSLDYKQAPFTPVYTDEEMSCMYGKEVVDLARECIIELPIYPSFLLWELCDEINGLSEKKAENIKYYDLVQYYANMAETDKKNFCYALKSVFNQALYNKIKSMYQPVDYSTMVEKTNGVKFSQEIACAGGQCIV